MTYVERVVKDFESKQFLSSRDGELLPGLVRFLPEAPSRGRDEFLILDVGSGPTTRLGTNIPGEGRAEIVPIDVHADEYLFILGKLDIDVPIKPIQMRAEDAGRNFPEVHFDLIFLRNVVHELNDPPRVVNSLIPLLRPGCSLLIFNVTDERLSGLGTTPLWNIELVDDNLHLRRNRRGWRRFKSTPIFKAASGARARSRHLTAKSFARLQIRRDGLNRREVHSEWERGKNQTMEFWSGRASNPDAYSGFKERFDADMPLKPGIAKHLPSGNGLVRILDVGSGPATNIGHKLPNRQLELTCIDVMADSFNALLADAGLQAPVPPIFGVAEEVDQQFDAFYFDIVFSRNALDHVADPVTALRSMLTVSKPDGCVIVWGHVNEAENQRYSGYHQWNFCWEENDFIIWRPGYRQAVSEIFGESVHLKSEGSDHSYSIVISRRAIL